MPLQASLHGTHAWHAAHMHARLHACPPFKLHPHTRSTPPAGKPMQQLVVKPETALIRPYVVAAILRGVTFDPVRYDSFIDLQVGWRGGEGAGGWGCSRCLGKGLRDVSLGGVCGTGLAEEIGGAGDRTGPGGWVRGLGQGSGRGVSALGWRQWRGLAVVGGDSQAARAGGVGRWRGRVLVIVGGRAMELRGDRPGWTLREASGEWRGFGQWQSTASVRGHGECGGDQAGTRCRGAVVVATAPPSKTLAAEAVGSSVLCHPLPPTVPSVEKSSVCWWLGSTKLFCDAEPVRRGTCPGWKHSAGLAANGLNNLLWA